MNGNEVCVPVVRGRGCRLVSRILPPQLFEFGGGEKGFNSRQELEESPSNWSTIFVSSDRVHFRFNLFEWIAIKEKIFESFYIRLFFSPIIVSFLRPSFVTLIFIYTINICLNCKMLEAIF